MVCRFFCWTPPMSEVFFSLKVKEENTKVDVSRPWSIVRPWKSHPRKLFWTTELPIPTCAMPTLQKQSSSSNKKKIASNEIFDPPRWSRFSPKVEVENTNVDVSRRWSIIQTCKSRPWQWFWTTELPIPILLSQIFKKNSSWEKMYVDNFFLEWVFCVRIEKSNVGNWDEVS